MKEFIDKMIGRLEELKNNRFKVGDCDNYDCNDVDDDCTTCYIQRIMSIINELAEEYERETDQTDYANIELYAFWKKHQWIPCSERLPKRNEYVLCYAKSTARGGDTWFVGSCDNGFWFLQSSIGTLSCPTQYEVVAWMPLPAPYTENKVSEMPTDWQQNIVGRFNRVE